MRPQHSKASAPPGLAPPGCSLKPQNSLPRSFSAVILSTRLRGASSILTA